MEKECPYCKQIISCLHGRIMSNHVRWCVKNPKYEITKKKYLEKIVSYNKNRLKICQNKYYKNPKCCKCCGIPLSYEYAKAKLKYCKQESCQKSAKNAAHDEMRKCRKQQTTPTFCKKCGTSLISVYGGRKSLCDGCKPVKQKRCKSHSDKVVSAITGKRLFRKPVTSDTTLEEYRRKCQFKFALNKYPDEFDFTLIETYGWYSPSNKKNNLQGVSRDHMFSVKDGYLLGISPEIISHPANCKLLKHSDNISKNYKSSITLHELQQRIDWWNKKYLM